MCNNSVDPKLEAASRLQIENHCEATGVVQGGQHSAMPGVTQDDRHNAMLGSKKRHRKRDKAVEVEKVPRMKIKHKCSKDFCKGKFVRRASFDTHLQCHSKHGLTCFLCQERFALWPACAIHMWRCHALDFDLYKCDDCDFRFVPCVKLID